MPHRPGADRPTPSASSSLQVARLPLARSLTSFYVRGVGGALFHALTLGALAVGWTLQLTIFVAARGLYRSELPDSPDAIEHA